MIEANLPLLVPLTFLIPALLIPLIGVRAPGAAYPLALAAVLASIPIAGFGLFRVVEGGPVTYTVGGWEAPIGIELVLDPLASFLTLVVTVVSCLVLIHARQVASVEHPDKRVPYYSLVLLLLAGFCGILSTGDLFNLYVFLEISSLAGYGLVAIGDKRAPVSAYRYLILGSVGTGFYLLGIGFIYVMSGSLNMADLARILPHILDEPTVLAGLILTVTGIGVKTALFPLHFWLPDAYSSASSASSALLAPLGTKVGAYILIRVLFFVFDPSEVEQRVPITTIIAWMSAAGILYGSLMALAQQELKRMLAYSSIAQIGYIGLGLGMATPLGFTGAVLHILNHAVMKAALFLVAGNLRVQLGHSNIAAMDQRLSRRMPWSMAAFVVAALSMIGLPPTAGFFSKWYLVLGGIQGSYWVFVAVILLGGLLNTLYFFRVVEKVYLPMRRGRSDPAVANGGREIVESGEARLFMLAPTLVLAGLLLALGLASSFLVNRVIHLMIPAGL